MKNFIKFFLFMSVFLSNNTQDVKNNEYVHNEQSWGQVTKKYQNSVLQLFTWSHDYSWAEPFKAPEVSGSCASCFFINDDGLLLTNYHCVKNAVVMYVQMPLFGKKRFKVEIVAVCPDRDLALLKLTPQSYEEIVSVLGQLLVLEIDDQNTVNRGDDIMLMGYPLGQESLKSTTGVVSGLQYVYNRGIRFQLTAPTNPGNSGGPALNKEGKVVGVLDSLYYSAQAQNVNYMILSQEVKVFLDHLALFLKENDKQKNICLSLPDAGLIFQPGYDNLYHYMNVNQKTGVCVTEVFEKMLGESFGIKVGDIITHINNYEIDYYGEINCSLFTDKISISSYCSLLPINSLVKLTIIRDGQLIDLQGVWKNINKMPITTLHWDYDKIDYLALGGLVLVEVSENFIEQISSNFNNLEILLASNDLRRPCISISHVFFDSLAHDSRVLSPGMIITHINDKPVKTIKECRDVIREADNFVVFTTYRNVKFVVTVEDLLKTEQELAEKHFYTVDTVFQDLSNRV